MNNRYAAVLSEPALLGTASFFAEDFDLLPPGPDNVKGAGGDRGVLGRGDRTLQGRAPEYRRRRAARHRRRL